MCETAGGVEHATSGEASGELSYAEVSGEVLCAEASEETVERSGEKVDGARLPLLLMVGLSIVGKVGEGVAPALLSGERPLTLLLLNASDATCLLTAAATSTPLAWWCVAAD